ncbi:MAG: hypothetical protein AB1726_15415 [Planctomycetota bacterium]
MHRSLSLAALLLAAAGLLVWLVAGPREPEVETFGPAVARPPADPAGGEAEVPAPGGEEVVTEALAPATPARREMTEDGAANLVLEIRLAGGGPAAGARVALFDAGEVLSAGAADAGGRVALRAPEAGCEVAVFHPEAPLRRQAIAARAAREKIALAPGAAVAGWIVVDGAEPGEETPLQFLPKWYAPDFLPKSVWTALETEPGGVRGCGTRWRRPAGRSSSPGCPRPGRGGRSSGRRGSSRRPRGR